MAFTSLGNFLEIPSLRRSSIFVFVVSYALTAWAITFHRIFDVRQVFLSLGQRLAVAFCAVVGVLGFWQVLGEFFPTPADLLLSITLCGSGAFWLDRKSRSWLGLTGEKILAELRATIIEISRTEPHPDRLILAFEELLRIRSQTSLAALLMDRGEAHAAGHLEFTKRTPSHDALCASGWATPESLQRRRSTPALAALRSYLLENDLGLMIAVPGGSTAPSLVVALGTRANQWPYTYPEVQRLQNVAELMDGILIRARLTTQAALKARLEHLAMMSRGLAHDLNNLITPISSYLVHTDGRSEEGSPEQEVHAAAKRSVRTMTEYVREALFFANRMEPKIQEVRLRDIFIVVGELMLPLAARREVSITFSPPADVTLPADAVLIQRLMGNLITNAIDASPPGGQVTISAHHAHPGWVRLEVADQGCGISSENLKRVFDPYFTTKKLGDDTRGFGLGLTICQKIVELHGGFLSAQSEPSRGSTLIVDLPTKSPMPSTEEEP